ncbi:rps3; small ribosomal protein 3 [Arcobacter nitrofigilis DSM 7299]|uniref:Rps3 small ribosomal protein 3 n=1 Tax=Arcobacter nitrofigilis (strain ATCC 33309 / DSM 7299 / CCUG 15893 / LMG 7604 / NCTC 12251 / CI) TaxID=572480 RepID=D5V5G5_ARCNC|nr:hypothetical protein [Arcobacter nitrofigilis]ADG93100.1 rps3; small ribosomal protein 3 [Arcobacter nitrofigilis DSM 7299]
MYKEKIIEYYKLLKEKKVDKYLIIIGIIGVIIGFFFKIPIINQIFVWPVLLGVCIRLYDFTEKIEREIVPYDFNRLLPPPKKNSTKK